MQKMRWIIIIICVNLMVINIKFFICSCFDMYFLWKIFGRRKFINFEEIVINQSLITWYFSKPLSYPTFNDNGEVISVNNQICV